jgi:hypothetical protein
MTVIQKYTPFWRDLNVDTCNKSRDIIYIPLNNSFNFQIPEDTKIGYSGGNYFDLSDVATDVYSFDIDEDYEVKINGEYENVLNQKFTLNLYGSENEFIETIGVIQFVNCDDLIQIDYQLNCNDEFYYYYYFKGAVTRKPANQTESTTFLNNQGVSELIFSITEKPVLLRTTPLGWIEQDYIESIINLFTIKVNGMEIFKSKTPYTVTSSKTPKMIGTILLVTSALIFNACCKDVTTPVKNYRVLDAYTSDNFVTFEFADYYESSGGWSTTSDDEAVTINVSGILYTLSPTDLNSVSIISGVYYTIYGTQIADLIYDKWVLDTNPLKPLITKSGKTITIVASLSATIITGRIDNISELVTPSNINWLNINTIAYYYKDTSSFSTVNFILAYINQKNLKLIVNINGVDTDVTAEIVDNVWTRLASSDIITTYKITSEDGLTTYRAGTVEIF